MGVSGVKRKTYLERAAELGMVLVTNNARDFVPMAQQWIAVGRGHAGILISEQFRNRELGEFLRRLVYFLDTVTAEEMHNTVR